MAQDQAAYEGGDWRELEFLVGMVDDVLKGAGAVDAGGDALAELEKSVARLEERLRELESRRAELMAKEPLCWREFLEDADEVAARRSALEDEIGKLEERLAEYEAMWDRREVA